MTWPADSAQACPRRRSTSPTAEDSRCATSTTPGSGRLAVRAEILRVERLVDRRPNEPRQLANVSIAVPLVEGTSATVRLRHQQHEMARTSRSSDPLGCVEEGSADPARLAIFRDQ